MALGLIGVLELGDERGVMKTSGELGVFTPGELVTLSSIIRLGVLGVEIVFSMTTVVG